MAFKFNGDVSLVDIVSLGSAALVGLFVVFGYGADIRANSAEIEDNAEAIAQQRMTHIKDKDDLLDEMQGQRIETREQFDKMDGKLDTVIQHLLTKDRPL
jgi:hypothetical protein